MVTSMLRPSVVLAACAALALSGCASGNTVVSEKSLPPSDQAYQEPALSVPPDYGQRPTKADDNPKSEIERKRQLETRKREAALKAAERAGEMSPGTLVLLNETKVPQALPNIRKVLNSETSIEAQESPAFVDKLVFGTGIPASGKTATDGKGGKGGKSPSDSEIVLRQGGGSLF